MLFGIGYRAIDIVSLFSGVVSFIIECLVMLALIDLGFGFLRDKNAFGSEDSQVFGEFSEGIGIGRDD